MILLKFIPEELLSVNPGKLFTAVRADSSMTHGLSSDESLRLGIFSETSLE